MDRPVAGLDPAGRIRGPAAGEAPATGDRRATGEDRATGDPLSRGAALGEGLGDEPGEAAIGLRSAGRGEGAKAGRSALAADGVLRRCDGEADLIGG